MSVIVTGGCGFIGSHLVERLVAQGEDVLVIDNLSTGSLKNVRRVCDKMVLYQQDVASPWATTKPVSVIYHLAALPRIQPSFRDPIATYHCNSTGTMAVLEYARQNPGVRVVYAGSSSVYHDHFANPYSYTKWVAEEHCRLYNKLYHIPVAIARFFNVYGPRQLEEGAYATVIGIFEKQHREGLPLTITGSGEQRRDFTHVDDIVNGLISMAQDDWAADVFNLGSGKNYSINEVAAMFGGPKTYIPARPGEAWITLADLTVSREKLGYAPRGDLRAYIEGISGSRT